MIDVGKLQRTAENVFLLDEAFYAFKSKVSQCNAGDPSAQRGSVGIGDENAESLKA